MKRTLSHRILSAVISIILLFTLVFSGTVASAWESTEGVVCSSRFGRLIMGSDGLPFHCPANYPVMLYDEEGNTSYSTSAGDRDHPHMYLYTELNVDEQWVYCIEVGVSFGSSNNGYTSVNGENSRFFMNLPRVAQEGIMLATVYGFQHGKPLPISGINEDDYYFATQAIIWEYQQNLRTSPTTLQDNGPIPATQFYDQLKDRPAEAAYNWILTQMEQHSKIPSFANVSSYEAPTHTMQYDAQSGLYSVTLTDENLSDVDLQALSEDTHGISVTRNGNSYTFTTSNPITEPVSILYRKDLPVYGNPFLVWGHVGYQTMCTGVKDPVQFYVNFQTENTGTLDIVKKADPDISVAGWQFRIEGNGVNQEVTVGEDGRISVPGLTAGTYTISEINVPDYYHQPESQTVEVLPNQTTVVEFFNQYQKGGLVIEKSSEQDVMTQDVQFRVVGQCDNGKSYDQIHETDASGRIELTDLYTGTYTVTELGYPETGIPDWIVAPTDENIRVNGGETSTVEIYNELKKGNLSITKASEDGNFIEGIGFHIFGTTDAGILYDETFYTDSSGEIYVEDLPIGTYTVEEVAETVNGNYQIAASQVVVIKGDETTQTQFYNALHKIPLRIVKESYNGKNLEGIQFLVKGTTSTGEPWEKTYTTNAQGVVDVKETDPDAPPCGTYTVSEVESSVNIGYLLPDSQEVTFTYGDQPELHFYNDKKAGDVKVVKTDDLNNHFVEGMVFRLKGTSYAGDEIDWTATTDKDGVAVFHDVPIGSYTLYEDDVPAFFVTPDPQEVTVVYSETSENNFENVSQKANLKIVKQSTDMQNIEGVPFRIVGIPYAGEDFAYDETFYTDANGEIYVEGLLVGNYSVMELDSDVTVGYIKPGSQEVELTYGQDSTVTFFNKLIENSIKIVKRDGFNDQPMEGILFGLYDSEGNEVTRGRTDANGTLTFENIRYGEYTVRELEGKTGYYPLEAGPQITVETDGLTQEIPIVNDRIPCEIRVYKTDSHTGEPLPGVTFGLFDLEGNLVEKAVTGEDGYARFSPQVWGQTFQIKELEVPVGYQLSDHVETVEIQPGETELQFQYENDRIPCEIPIYKTDGYTKLPLAGAVFGLYDAEGNLIEQKATDENGYIQFSPQLWGQTVFIREISAPEGYLVNDKIEEFEIKAGDESVTFEWENERRPVEIVVHKIDESGLPLAGAEFGLFDAQGTLLQSGITDETGVIRFTNNIWGQTVYLREIKAPQGYVLDEAATEIELKPEDTVLEYTKENYWITGNIRIVKKDGLTGNPLSGVEFGLYDEAGNEVARGVTGEDGALLLEGIRYGTYELRELAAKDGYQNLSAPLPVQITENGQTIELEVENEPIPEVPDTGEEFPAWPIALLVVSATAFVLLLVIRKQKQRIG